MSESGLPGQAGALAAKENGLSIRDTRLFRTPLKNASKSPWRRCGSAQNAHPAAAGLRAAPRLLRTFILEIDTKSRRQAGP